MNDYRDTYDSHVNGIPPYYGGYLPPIKLKRKWISCLFSLFIPGTGHMYLGMLQRGFLFMCLLACNISLITMLVSQDFNNTALITLISLFIPITYFYNIFDVLQTTDKINQHIMQGATPAEAAQQLTGSGANLGYWFIGVGGWFFLLSVKPAWLSAIIGALSSYLGGLLLVVVGVVLVIYNYRRK